MEPTIPTTTISLSRRVNLGNYESADVFMSINGITHETTEEDINALLDGPGAVAYRCIRTRLAGKVKEMKGVPATTSRVDNWDSRAENTP